MMNAPPRLPYIFHLSRPIEVNGRPVAALTVSELTLGGYKAVRSALSPATRTHVLVSRSCGIPESAVSALDPADLSALAKIAGRHVDAFSAWISRTAAPRPPRLPRYST